MNKKSLGVVGDEEELLAVTESVSEDMIAEILDGGVLGGEEIGAEDLDGLNGDV